MTSLWNGLQSLLGGIVSFFYGVIPNLGVAIILLTLVVGLVLFPLTLKQTRSMRAMQEIQPEVKRLQAEFKQDRQLLQEKTMALYKEKQKEMGVTWRSFRNEANEPTISDDWRVRGWPTLYYIDHEGVIKHKNIRGESQMEEVLEEMIAAAEAAQKK